MYLCVFMFSSFHQLIAICGSSETICQVVHFRCQFGLKHATSKTIEIEQRERAEECKREMLIAWLQRLLN